MHHSLHSLCAGVALSTVAASAHASDLSDACQKVHTTENPSEAELEACLPSDPLASVQVSVGYDLIEHFGGKSGLGGSYDIYARADKRLGVLWLNVAGRYFGSFISQVDAIAGFTFHDYGRDWEVEDQSTIEGVSTTTTITHSGKIALRTDRVLGGGIKAMYAPGTTDANGMAVDGKLSFALAAGGQIHRVSGYGNHTIIEGYLLYGLRGGLGAIATLQPTFGSTGRWNATLDMGVLPTPGDRLVFFGMKLGYALDL